MTDYISREELISRLKAMSFYPAMVRRAIESTPAADVAPVVHGRWIPVPSSDMMTGKAYKCSNCEKIRYGSYLPPYCQCCGAKMDWEEEMYQWPAALEG